MNTSHQPARFKLRHIATVLGATGALAFGSASVQAQGIPGLNVYVGGGVGQSNADVSAPDFDEKDFAWKAFVGVRAFSFVGAELNYIDFGKPSGGGVDVKYKGIAGYGLFYLPLPLPVLDVYLKGGLARIDVNPSFAVNTDDTKFAYGAGAQLKFGSFAIRGEYEKFKIEDAKPSLLSLGFSKSSSNGHTRAAMSMIRGLLDRLVLIGGVLVGGCVPGFITQYHQRVGGRLDQVQIDLAPFQGIARQFHGGDIHKLVDHYLASPDPSFHATGEAVQAMINSLTRLQGMMDSLSGSVWHQIGYLSRHFDREIGTATWQNFLPSFNLDPASLVVAGAFGVACWLLFLGIWSGVSSLGHLIAARVFTASRR